MSRTITSGHNSASVAAAAMRRRDRGDDCLPTVQRRRSTDVRWRRPTWDGIRSRLGVSKGFGDSLDAQTQNLGMGNPVISDPFTSGSVIFFRWI